MNAELHDPVIEIKVLMIQRCCSMGPASALLNDGQNIHRKIVPIIANVSDPLLAAFSWVGYS